METNRPLARSHKNRVIAGVCGGIAEYLNVEPIFVRAFFVVLAFVNGAGILLYFIMLVAMPKQPFLVDESGIEPDPTVAPLIPHARIIIGLVLIALGFVALVNQLYPLAWFQWRYVWPSLIILAGFFLITNTRLKR